MIVTDDVRRESTIEQQRDRFSWRSWTAVFRMRVLYETEAFCHRLEDVSSSLRGLPTLKELSATLRPGLHTPSTQMEGPLVRDDAEVALVLSLPLSFFLPSLLSLSLSPFVCLSLSLPVFSGPSPTLFAAVPVISSLARVEDSTSPRAPALLLWRSVRFENSQFRCFEGSFRKLPRDNNILRRSSNSSRVCVSISTLVAAYCVGMLARWRFVDEVLETFSFLRLVCLVMTLRYPLMHHLHVRSLVKDTRCVYRWENSIWRSRDVEQYRSILLDILIFGREILSIFSERNVENLSVLQTSSRYTMRSLSLCCTGSLSILVFGILFGAGGRFQHSSGLPRNDFFIRFVLQSHGLRHLSWQNLSEDPVTSCRPFTLCPNIF